MTSRTPARRCSCASAMSPPMTIAPGLKKLTSRRGPRRARGRRRAPCGSPRVARRDEATTSRLRDARRARRRQPRRPAPGRPRPPRGSRRCRSGRRRRRGGHADVADVAGGALGAAVDLAAGDDAAADAGADLDENRCSVSRQWVQCSPQGHDVDVVVDEHRRAVAVGEPVGDREAVPAGHDRRVTARRWRIRPGRGRRCRCRARRRPCAGLRRAARRSALDASRARLGPARDGHVEARLGQRLAAEVATPRGGSGSRRGRRPARRRPRG